MVLPGIIARRLYPAELLGRTNEALPLMMKRLLPPGLLGLNLAATVAACMSSLDSVCSVGVRVRGRFRVRVWVRACMSSLDSVTHRVAL